MGRPKKEFNPDDIYQMAKEGCSVDDIATELGCSDNHIYNHYYDVFKEGQAAGRRALHKKQFDKALEGDASMLKWLGANRLGQSEKIQQSNDAQSINITIRSHEEKQRAGDLGTTGANGFLAESSEA